MPHILIVEDEQRFPGLAAHRLPGRSGHDQPLPERGQRCGGLVRQQPPDLILLDLMLPGRPGHGDLQRTSHLFPGTHHHGHGTGRRD